jgi:phage shock protein A
VAEPTTETLEERTESTRSIDLVLQQLWDKARRVSALVVRLREENAGLRVRTRELEESNREIFGEREKLIVRLAQQEASGRDSVDELATLRQRVRQLEDVEVALRRSLDDLTVQLEQSRREVSRLTENGAGPFTRQEKELIRQRVTDLIAKINSRL